MDGGNTFEFVCDLLSNFVRKTAHCFHTSTIAFITDNGSIYIKKAGKELSFWGCKLVLHLVQKCRLFEKYVLIN